MEQLLAQGVPTERNLEKNFKGWLAGCHERLDKTTQFCELLPDQPALRAQYGERGTFFRSMSDGKRTIEVRACTWQDLCNPGALCVSTSPSAVCRPAPPCCATARRTPWRACAAWVSTAP